MKFPTFERGIDPLKADNWVLIMEKIFAVAQAQCPETHKSPIMLVSEYDRIFTDLRRFAPHVVDTNAHKARRFEEGLKDGLRELIKLLRLQTHANILNVALLSKEDQAKRKAKEKGQKRKTTFAPARNQGGGSSFKK
ncbi:hypothetical protein RHSIM_Rhsim09G0059300 [Rhododendron simsii]|uniref:Uncharacterized protein n=1 Tax=Rhododendron simsii TaxID=118357 RepID=A0A834LE55_RHOSS|nr:hypothetical protein RHSIM_Rhsim09G0059300 [Rhododendron simsii]